MNPSLGKSLNILGFAEIILITEPCRVKKQKGEQAGLENRLFPLKWRRRGKDLIMEPNPFPPKGGEKYLTHSIKLILKKY